MLDLGHVLFGGRLFREGPGQHELGFEDDSSSFDDSVEGRRHPRDGRVLHQALDISDSSAGIPLIPASVEVLGDLPKLYDEIAGEVLRAHFSALLAPKPNEGRLVVTHNDASVGATKEGAATDMCKPMTHVTLPPCRWRSSSGWQRVRPVPRALDLWMVPRPRLGSTCKLG